MTDKGVPETVQDRILRRRGRPFAYENIDPQRTARVAIDLQVGSFRANRDGSPPHHQPVVPAINRTASSLRRLGGLVVWVRTTFQGETFPARFVDIYGPERAHKMRRDLAPGGPGHAFIAEAERRPADLCVDKHHYSAFATAVCPLSVELAARHINTVLIAGVLTNVCCESSARDASIQGFRVVLLSDANGARNAVEHVAALTTIAQCFGDVRASDDTIALMEASSAPVDGAPALA